MKNHSSEAEEVFSASDPRLNVRTDRLPALTRAEERASTRARMESERIGGVRVAVPTIQQRRGLVPRARRTCGGRRRPGGSRRVSRPSSSSGDPSDTDEPGERPRHLDLAPPKKAVYSFACIDAITRGEVVA